MRKFLFFILTATIFLTACQRELDSTLPTNTNPLPVGGNAIIAKTIKVVGTDPNDAFDVTIAPKYDSVNRKLNVYIDNPATTSTVYDELYYTYEFNVAGYLTKQYALDDNQVMSLEYDIYRNANNEIQKIVGHDIFGIYGYPPNGRTDTVYFSYNQVGGQLVVKDSIRNGLASFYSQITNFNSSKAPVTIRKTSTGTFENVFNYSYNSQGQVTSIKGTYDTVDYVYDNSPIAAEWKNNLEFYLGKDGWLLNQIEPSYELGFNFLTFLFDSDIEKTYNLLFMPPVASVRTRGFIYPFSNGQYQDNRLNFTNSFSSDHKPVSVSIQKQGGFPINFTFTY